MSNIDKERISMVAKKVREKFKSEYGIYEFNKPFEIISKLEKYIIIRFPFEEEIQGFTVEKNGYKCIYINSKDVLARQNYSCWHEFYHSMDDRNLADGKFELSIKNSKDSVEKEAEYFASCMLLDKEELVDYIRKNWGSERSLSEVDLIDIQYRFGVSYKALKLKLKEIYNDNYFFKFKINEKGNEEKYLEEIRKKGYEPYLALSTNDFCIPISFKEDLLECYKNKKIGIEKVEQTIDFLNEKGVEFRW